MASTTAESGVRFLEAEEIFLFEASCGGSGTYRTSRLLSNCGCFHVFKATGA